METYAVGSHSGGVRKAGPPVCSGGNSPVALAISPGYANLYVANQADRTVVHFAVADNGVMTSKDTVTLSSAPVALAVNSSWNPLYLFSGAHRACPARCALSFVTTRRVTLPAAFT